MKGFINRTVSGAIILLVTVLSLYFKGLPLIAYSVVVSGLCLIELFNAFKIRDLFVIIISFCFSVLIFYYINNLNIYMILISISFYFIINSIYYLFSDKINIVDFSRLMFAFIYISLPMGIFLKMGFSDSIWFVYIISWGTDTFAYLVGVLFGKHKLCPSISPKKTIEGSVGGILGAVLLSNILNYYLFKYNFMLINFIAVFASVIAEIGDLLASKIKREVDIKDFGSLISGHGGFLDRFDSIIFVTPVIYMIFYIFGGKI